MLNPNWYLVCNVSTNTAVDLIQLQDTWGGTVTGLLQQTDDQLSKFNEWSPHSDVVFLRIQAARTKGINSTSIDTVIANARPAILDWIRSMRDPLLAATDVITPVDRWNTLDVVAQKYATTYRQALRDMTNSVDLLNVTWPPIPPVLNQIRSINIDTIARPSQEFINALLAPFPALTLQQRRNDQWLRAKAYRDLRKTQGLKLAVNGKDYWFWTDDTNRGQYSILDSYAVRKALPPTAALANWKTMSGEFVSFTVELLHRVLDAGVDNEDNLFVIAEGHHAAIMASTNPDNYDYTQGYPQVYFEYAAYQVLLGNTNYGQGN